jgi:hypothetical protein
MTRLFVFISIALLGCSSAPSKHDAPPIASTNITGTVDKVCLECNEALIAGGGGSLWDVLTVRITSPEALSGTVISVEVLVKGSAQRKRYPQGSSVAFSATAAALEERRVMLYVEDLGG